MASLTHLINLQPHFDKYAQQILDKTKSGEVEAATAATTTIATTKISNFLQEFGASFINSIQLQNFQKTLHSSRYGANANLQATNSTAAQFFNSSTEAWNQTASGRDMDMDYIQNQIIIDSSTFDSMDELQKQLEYDKFMNEVWIGIVLTLILISMIFCICSCFLYHQFRTWKRNYHTTVVRANSHDIESLKTENMSMDDPVPEYTLVSGLPSYEAALELMQKSPTNSCLIVYPSVFSVFNKNEKTEMTHGNNATTPTITDTVTATMFGNINQQNIVDSTTPLLTNTTTAATITTRSVPTSANLKTVKSNASLPNYADIMHNSTMLTIDFNNSSAFQTTNLNEKELLELLNETASLASEQIEQPLEKVEIVQSKK